MKQLLLSVNLDKVKDEQLTFIFPAIRRCYDGLVREDKDVKLLNIEDILNLLDDFDRLVDEYKIDYKAEIIYQLCDEYIASV